MIGARTLRAVRLAVAFLTILPIPIRDEEVDPASLADARFAYPLVGLMIGLILAALAEGFRRLGVGAGPSAFLILLAWASSSGGLHLDGLADTADGLFLWGDPARRLAAMRDPHVGGYGVSAVGLVLIGKFAALESLFDAGRPLGLIVAATIGRTLILVSAGMAPYARPEGTGRALIDAAGPRDAAWGAILSIGVATLAAGGRGLAAATLGLALAGILTATARRKIGGVTGDTLGALVEVGELGVLLILA